MSVFVRAIPYNYYALLTIVMMVSMVLMKAEFGAMGVHESNALKGDLFTTATRPYAGSEGEEKSNPRGKVMDLLIPIISLVILPRHRYDLHWWIFQRNRFCNCFFSERCVCRTCVGKLFRPCCDSPFVYGSPGIIFP